MANKFLFWWQPNLLKKRWLCHDGTWTIKEKMASPLSMEQARICLSLAVDLGNDHYEFSITDKGRRLTSVAFNRMVKQFYVDLLRKAVQRAEFKAKEHAELAAYHQEQADDSKRRFDVFCKERAERVSGFRRRAAGRVNARKS